jgi:putative ABC transport system substrate-binding protein
MRVTPKVDLIFADGGAAAGAAKQATASIPIVMSAGDPVAQGLVTSLARPGGNITGVSAINAELSQKRLEIFKEALAGLSLVAVLWCPDAGVGRQQLRETHGAAQALGVRLLPLEVRSPDDVEALVETATRERVEGLVVLPCAIIPRKIVEFAARSRLPAMYGGRGLVEAGGLISYGADRFGQGRRAAAYVDKILKGAKPADLPIEQPSKFELVINLKTAKALGLTIPPVLLFQADKVMQ